MGSNRRKPEDRRREAAEKEAANRRRDRCPGAWNERQAKRMPMLFSPTVGAPISAGYRFLLRSLPRLLHNQCD